MAEEGAVRAGEADPLSILAAICVRAEPSWDHPDQVGAVSVGRAQRSQSGTSHPLTPQAPELGTDTVARLPTPLAFCRNAIQTPMDMQGQCGCPESAASLGKPKRCL